jgi:hypothetical protein
VQVANLCTAILKISVPTCTARATVAVGRWCDDIRMRGNKGAEGADKSCTPTLQYHINIRIYIHNSTPAAHQQQVCPHYNIILTLEYTFLPVHVL